MGKVATSLSDGAWVRRQEPWPLMLTMVAWCGGRSRIALAATLARTRIPQSPKPRLLVSTVEPLP